MHVLIIEDELKTANYLAKGLTENGFVVDKAANGIDGLFNALQVSYDLLILDVMLPQLTGWDIVTKIRQHNSQLPILMLTARDAIEDRVKGLELGADDYLVKPFTFSELLARVRALLRRGQIKQVDTIRISDLTIDVLQHKVTRNNNKITLTAKEFALLILLARRQSELLSRTFITEQVWGINFDTDTNIVDVAIRRLRQKIDEGYDKKLIHTLRGVGYVLEEKDN
jgi:two-component system copper resistance phosphate regulon response regulator CusR